MENRPREPVRDGERIVERHEVTERQTVAAGTGGTAGARSSTAWLWLIPLLLVVGVLLWYVMTRGERRDGPVLDVPALEAPTIDRPATQQRIEIQLPQQQEPAPAPASGAGTQGRP